MGDLADFLSARIDEDEEVARAVRPGDATTETSSALVGGVVRAGSRGVEITTGRLLAECAHRQGVVAAARTLDQDRAAGPADGSDPVSQAMLLVLRHLAAPYADHPDYADEWRLPPRAGAPDAGAAHRAVSPLPADLDLPAGRVLLRRATAADVPAVVALLADDPLGQEREDTGPQAVETYQRAFATVDADPAQLLLVAELDGAVVATLQVATLPGLSRRGAVRAQLEAVRVTAPLRSGGLGSALVRWVVEDARRRGCSVVQLTSDKGRTDAHRFYARLGFAPSHEGMRLAL